MNASTRAFSLGVLAVLPVTAFVVGAYVVGRGSRTSHAQAQSAAATARRAAFVSARSSAYSAGRASGKTAGLAAGSTDGATAGRRDGRKQALADQAKQSAVAQAQTTSTSASASGQQTSASQAGNPSLTQCPGGGTARGECPNENPFVSSNGNGTCTDVTSNSQVPCSYLNINNDPNHRP